MLTLLTNKIRKNSLKKIGTLVVFVALSVGGGEVKRTLTADFTKCTKTKSGMSGVESVKGNLYGFENRMVIKVTSPIIQYLIIDSGTTVIYNSGERSAFRLLSTNPAVFPFFATFIGFFKGDQMVPQVNFRIHSSVKRGDSLYTLWVPGGDKNTFRGEFETVYCNDNPVRVTTSDKKGKLLYQMTFGHDSLIDGARVPLRISTLTPVRSDSLLEEVEFSRVSVNKPIPDDITHFKIPPDVPIKVLKW